MTSEEELSESTDSLDEENDTVSLTESVEKLKKKTIKSMKKWNDENFLYAIDRQLTMQRRMRRVLGRLQGRPKFCRADER